LKRLEKSGQLESWLVIKESKMMLETRVTKA